MRFRMNRPGVSAEIVHQFDRIVLTTEETPATAATVPGRDQLGKGVDMSNRTNVRSDERRLIALEYLQRAADDLTRAAVTRIRYIGNARTHNATWRDIATVLGITETGARMLYERNRDLIDGDA